jgi:hypothetical protein
MFRRGDYRKKSHNHENQFWVRVPLKILGLGIIIFFSYDIQRYVSNDEAYDKLSGKKN